VELVPLLRLLGLGSDVGRGFAGLLESLVDPVLDLGCNVGLDQLGGSAVLRNQTAGFLLLLYLPHLNVVFQALVPLAVLHEVSQQIPASETVLLFVEGLVPEVRHHVEEIDLVLDVLELHPLYKFRHDPDLPVYRVEHSHFMHAARTVDVDERSPFFLAGAYKLTVELLHLVRVEFVTLASEGVAELV